MVRVLLAQSNDDLIAPLLAGIDAEVTAVDLQQLDALITSPHRPADVVVVDTRGAAGLPRVIAEARRRHADLGVVIVSSNHDSDSLLEAMRAGAHDVVCEPLTARDFETAIARAVSSRRLASARQVVAFLGAKGGVGATTLAVNVAATLAAADKSAKTLLVDLHTEDGDVAAFFAARPAYSLADACANVDRLDQTLLRGLVTPVAPQLDVLAATGRPDADGSLAANLAAVLNVAARVYRHIILDVAPAFRHLLGSRIDPGAIVVVGNDELLTLQRATRVIRDLRGTRPSSGVQFVLNRFHGTTYTQDEIERVVGVSVAHTFPSAYRLLIDAAHRGKPLDPRSQAPLQAAIASYAARLTGTAPRVPKRSWLDQWNFPLRPRPTAA